MSQVTPYEEAQGSKKVQVTQMFDNISGGYDRLNRVITFGMDISWRKNVLKMISAQHPESILDIATGTGDMPILFSKSDAKKIVGLDISSGMLSVAEDKIEKLKLNDRIQFQLGDAEALPFEDASFDAVTVCYGIRNFEDLNQGLSEILRVLKPNGTMVILETSVPASFPFKQGYFIYTKYMLPLIGKLFSKDKKAYSYLSESAMTFPYGAKLKKIIEDIGFQSVLVKPQAQGISTIYESRKGSA